MQIGGRICEVPECPQLRIDAVQVSLVLAVCQGRPSAIADLLHVPLVFLKFNGLRSNIIAIILGIAVPFQPMIRCAQPTGTTGNAGGRR